MATDKLIFPIGFDLEKAVADAEGQADKLLRRLETTIRSRPLAVNLKITNAGSGSINEINARMKEIVKEWNNLTEAERIGSKTSGEYTDRAKKLIAEFTRLTGATESYARGLQQITAAARKAANEQERNLEKQRKTEAILKAQENTIANITAKLQHYKKEMNSAEMGSKQFRKAAEEVKRLSHNLTEAQRRVNALTGNFKNQDGYVSRLVKRLAVYAGYQQLTNFITSVREVTAEFELQRISLGAIIQDQAKANQLFSEIKQFALKSPVKILDLTKYTKQLAAYKFETKELFDWTKRLTDISVGLGVSMDRIILLAGQIRATGYLRGSEVRQATEAGIPLVEELAKKLEELNGRAYTTAKVMNLISERAISWDMVADVFKDMTSAGGMFFDIQEKQGNTLYGMWQKLGDAASVMYEEIGNTKSINDGMKNLISTLRSLMLNWKQTGAALATVGVAVLLYINRVRLAEKMVELSIIAESKSVLALKSKQAALTRLIAIQRASTGAVKADTLAMKIWTAIHLRGVQAVNLMKAAVKGLTAALAKNIWGIAILGLSLLVEKLWLAEDATEKLKNKLSDIKLDYEVKQEQDASNFEYLANAAVEAAKGSKAQKDALEELKNTYGKIIPLELLTIENLERMKGNYGELIALIDEYNLKQKHEAETSAIEESFAPEQEKRAGIIREKLRKGLRLDYADEETGGVFDKVLDLSERNIQRFLLNLNKYAEEGETKGQQIIKASKDLAKELGLNEGETQALIDAMWKLDRGEFEGQGTLMDYTEGLQRKHEALSVVNEDYDKAKQKLNEFSSIVDDVMKKNEDEPEVTTYDNVIENEKARLNNQVGDVANGIIELFKTANAEVDSGTQQLLQTVVTNGGMIPSTVWDLLEKTAENINNPKLLAEIQRLRQHYQKLAPDSETVNFVRSGFIKIVNAAKGNMQEYRQYLYDGSVTIKEYQDNLNKSITSLKTQAYEMIKVNALIDAGLVKGQKYDEAAIKAVQDKADVLQSILDQYVTPLIMPDDKKSKSSGRKSDPRLQNLKEEISLVQKLYNEYKQLEKQEGASKAAEDMERMAKASLDMLSKKYGISLPTTVKDLTSALEILYKKMAALPKKVFPALDKELNELRWTIEKVNIDESQKQIEQQLKSLADRISRTKTAKEFYDKILSQTGDVELAANVTFSIYGENGEGLQKELDEQIEKLFGDYKIAIPKIKGTDNIDYLGVKRLAKEALDAEKIGEAAYKDIIKIAEDGQKDLAKIAEQGTKLLLTYDEIAQKRVNIEQEASEKIKQLRKAEALFLASKATEDEKKKYSFRVSEAIDGINANKDLGLLKLKGEYMRFFSAIHSMSREEAAEMRTQIRKAIQRAFQDGALSVDEFKRELKAVDEAFDRLDKDQGMAIEFLGNGIDGLIERLRTMADETETVAASLMKLGRHGETINQLGVIFDKNGHATGQLDKGQIDFIDEMLGKFGNESTGRSFAEMLKKCNGQLGAMGKALGGVAEGMGGLASGAGSALGMVDMIIKNVAAAIEGIAQIRDQLNSMRSDDNQLGGGFWDGFEYLENFNKYASAGWDKLKSGNVMGAAADTVSSVISIFGTKQAQRVRRANREIERQQELIDQLEYSYSRLEKAADKAFGGGYVNNIAQQEKVLLAQAQAYKKQAAAERSKGKKKDKDRIKEYEDSYRDTMDEIAELQSKVAEKMLGSDQTSAARDVAKAWLEAYKEIGRAGAETSAAMKEKFQDMIENMVVESVLGRVMESALKPMFKMIDEMDGQDFYSDAFWRKVAATAEQGAKDADAGAQTVMKYLEQAGLTLGEINSDSTGIAKQVASASSEEVNANTAALNTQNFYASHLPGIGENVAAMRRLMEAGLSGAATDANAGGWTDWQRQAMDRYVAIERNTADIIVECRRSAAACEEQVAQLRRVIVPRGTKGAWQVSVALSSGS